MELVDRDRASEDHAEHGGINRMAQIFVWAAPHEFVADSDAHFRAPIAA